jgi:hypothetical protein
MVEKFDCIYDTSTRGQQIPYCQRPNENYRLFRNQTQCDNGGKKRSFRHLIDENIPPNDILKWNSSVEMADLYAMIYSNQSLIQDNDDHFICQCIKLGTFGKYGEYQLTHNTMTFSEAIKTQFNQKQKSDSWNT